MRALRFFHRWLGILLALPLLVQGLTGVLLTLEPVMPAFAPPPMQPGPAASANTVLAAAVSAVPAGMQPVRYLPPDGPGMPVRVQFAPAGQPRGPRLVVSLDPAAATLLGPPAQLAGPMDWVKRLHTSLLVPELGGRQVAGWMGVGLLMLTVLGIPLWWPTSEQRAAGRWQEAFTVPRTARGVRLHRRLHGAMGIWISLLLAVTSVTGIIQGFPQASRTVLGLPSGPAGPGPRGAEGRAGHSGGARAGTGAADTAPINLDGAIRLALEAVPGAQLRAALLPAAAGDAVRLILGPPGTEGVASATTVLVDPAGAVVRAIQPPSQAPAGEIALRWAHDLHFGQGFGPVWRGLTVLTGMALPLFGVTGVSLWWLKRQRRQRLDAMKDAAQRGTSQAGV